MPPKIDAPLDSLWTFFSAALRPFENRRLLRGAILNVLDAGKSETARTLAVRLFGVSRGAAVGYVESELLAMRREGVVDGYAEQRVRHYKLSAGSRKP